MGNFCKITQLDRWAQLGFEPRTQALYPCCFVILFDQQRYTVPPGPEFLVS